MTRSSRYSFLGEGLAQVPSWGTTVAAIPAAVVAAPAVASVAAPAVAAPAAVAGGGSLLSAILANILGETVAGGIQSAVAPGGLTPAPAQGGSGSKFMITLQDVKEIQRYVSEENYRRSSLNKLGGNYELLDADQIIEERESELRRSAAEAGAREYALKQLDVEAATRPAMAAALGTGLSSAGDVLESAIANIARRPDISVPLTEAARAF
jgi:hypothetical protein